jgi:hypothetical protein
MKTGTRLRSQVCTTEAIIIRAGSLDEPPTCGGRPMVPIGQETELLPPLDGLADGNDLGKRYTDESGSVELLVTKAGQGTLGIGSTPLHRKDAKPLPASD